MDVISLERARLRQHALLEDRARVAFINRDFDRALESAELAVRYLPGCAQGQLLLGDVFAAKGRHVCALKVYHRARRLSRNSAEPLWSISTVHFLAGLRENALKYLLLARARLQRGDGPLYEWIAEDLAITLLRLGRPAEALEAVRWGLRRRTRGARLRELRAEIKASRRLRLLPPSDRKLPAR